MAWVYSHSMSKPLSTFKEPALRQAAISRRIANKGFGLGFWSAVEAMGTRTENIAAQKAANKPAKVWDARLKS